MLKVTLLAPFDPVNLSGPTNAPYPPLRLAYLSAAAKQHGHDVTVIDGIGLGFGQYWNFQGLIDLHGLKIEQILERMPEDPDVIGISMLYSNIYPPLKELVKRVRAERPKALLILGGEGVTGLADRMVEDLPLDAAIVGEGEPALIEVLQAAQAGLSLYGLRNVVTASQKFDQALDHSHKGGYSNIDDLPLPDWESIPLENYWSNAAVHGARPFEEAKFLPAICSRGCPFKCRFCTAAWTWGRQRYRSVERVLEELRLFGEKYGVRHFTFHDLSLTTDIRWFGSFLDALERSGLKIRWYLPGGMRAENLSREILAQAKRTGLVELVTAPETGSKRVLEWTQKRLKVESVVETMRNAKDAGLRVQAFFIVGYPVETLADYVETLRLIWRLARIGIDEIVASNFTALPGSPHFNELMEAGRLELTDEFFAAHFQGKLGLRESYSPHFNGTEVRLLRLYALLLFYGASLLLRPARLVALCGSLLFKRGDTMLERVVARDWRKVARTFLPLLSLGSLKMLARIVRQRFCGR